MFKKILTSSLLFLITIGGFFMSIWLNINNVNAADAWETTIMTDWREIDNTNSANWASSTQTESKWLNDAIQLFNALLGVLSVIVSPAIILASWLMSPDWTSGDLFGLRDPMHKMWIVVSNIVYFVYAIILIMIALATIFGKDNFNYKVMLPKLALGAILVPFTWWFVQWTISLSAVVTAQVITIPYETLGKTNSKWVDEKIIPKNYYTSTLEKWKWSEKMSETAEQSNTDCSTNKNDCISPKEMFEKWGGMYSSLMIYAYDIFKLSSVKEISGTLNAVKTAGQLLNELIIWAIMFLVFGILVMALIAMLALRAIKLWMYAIFSPLFTLHFVAGKELFGKWTEGFDIKEFIGLCFVPAVVGLVLSFWLVVVSSIKMPATEKTNGCNEGNATVTITNGRYVSWWCKIMSLFGNPNNRIMRWIRVDEKTQAKYAVNVIEVAGMTYVYEWPTKLGKTDIVAWANSAWNALDAGGGIFGTIILDIIALIFIWMAFMAGKWVSKAVEVAVQPFEDLGKKIGWMAASIPKYTPLPIPGGSIYGAQKAVWQLENIKEQMADKHYKESWLGKFMASRDPSQNIPDELKTTAIRGGTASNGTESAKALRELSQASGQQLLQNEHIKKSIDKAVSNKTTVDDFQRANFSSNASKKLAEIIKDEKLSDEEKRVLVAAVMKWKEDVVVSKDKVWSTRAWLESQGAGWWSTGWSGTQSGNTSNGFSVKTAVDKPDNLIVNMWWVDITMNKNGDWIDKTELERLKTKIGTWTRAEFEENLKKWGISDDATIKKIADQIEKVEKDGNKFFSQQKS